MTKETLNSRIASFQNKIEKANSIVEKKQKLMLDKLAKSKVVDDIERKHLEFQIQLLVEEIYNKQRDIVEWKKSLSKYQIELMAMVSKKRDIPVLIEFLDRWKALNVDYFLGKANLTSLDGAPDEIGSSFNCRNNELLTSLDNGPKKVKGRFYCDQDLREEAYQKGYKVQ